jgi:hypothetical protein
LHRAAETDPLGLLDLFQCRSGQPDREEQLGIVLTAGRDVSPGSAVGRWGL